MRNTKGITLVSLVITIIILLILASIATYSGIHVIKSSKLTVFTTELKIMQTQVNAIYEEGNGIEEYGEPIEGEIRERADIVFAEIAKDAKTNIQDYNGYRYWSNETIKKIGIEGVEQDVFVNLEKRSIVSYQGLEYEGKTYYTLSQLPDGLYNVEYKNPNQGKPTFNISKESIGDNKWKITISNIQYEGYIDKWQVQYQLKGEDYWNTTEDFSFVVNTTGRYDIVLSKGDVKSDSETIWISPGWNDELNINVPNLSEGMMAVYWDTSNHEKILTSTSTEEEWNNWYEYKAGDNNNDTKTSRWANAKTSDGSYWVWIPRYEYKILSGEGTTTAGKIEVKFIPTSQTTADEGFKIHPAFIKGTSNHFKNGEWDSELAGIWVAKYEMSMETNQTHTETSNATIGDVLTKNAGNNLEIRAVSKPGVSSWRHITIGSSYTNAYYYDREKESHLMKNSEWGAVAYLTRSQYGRNGHEIDLNNSSTFITGNGGGSTNALPVSGVTNAYNTQVGVKASTTGNIYGIYDVSGGAWERISAYITNGHSNLSNGSSLIATTIANQEGYKTLSTKYATIYPYNFSSDIEANNYTAYKNLGYGYGDAILETSTSGFNSTSWFGQYSYFPSLQNPFFVRGSDFNASGIFSFSRTAGDTPNHSFRVVLIGNLKTN